LAISYEGHDIARWFNTFGVTGLVLDYRHRGKGYGHPAPLQDAQRAIRLTRANAAQWQVDPKRVGIMGFSAGGHLASTAATHFDQGRREAEDPIEHESCRPDFAILCYPVIAFGRPLTHHGTQQNLLGKDPDPALVANLSSERQVTGETPPTFLWSTWEDHVVPAENSIVFFQALKQAKVPAELHIFVRGRHGLGLAKGTAGTELWPDLCRAWLLNRLGSTLRERG
jgi:acetyl esterase/lipase